MFLVATQEQENVQEQERINGKETYNIHLGAGEGVLMRFQNKQTMETLSKAAGRLFDTGIAFVAVFGYSPFLLQHRLSSLRGNRPGMPFMY